MFGITGVKTQIRRAVIMLGIVLVLLFCVDPCPGADESAASKEPSQDRLKFLEQQVKLLTGEVKQLRKEREEDRREQQKVNDNMTKIMEDAAKRHHSKWFELAEKLNKFHFGGYGEMHANFGESSTSDQFDIHRLVAYFGYDFAEWIHFYSEIEIEHAFVKDGAGGEIVLEQAYVDFELDPAINIRAGRVLTPLGIINQKHEPTTFMGVERPLFAKYIIPTTWSSDGIGIYGSPCNWLDYQLYIVGGLDGSKFSATGGIRGGRIKERPSYHEPAITGRIDLHPFVGRELPHNQDLRLGVSFYHGGLDNGNKGSNPGINGDITIACLDFEYTVSRFDFRGAVAYECISNASNFGDGTASGIFGFYLEGAYHFMPESLKTGKLENSDAVAFIRYDFADLQHSMDGGMTRNPAGRMNEWTFGINFYPVQNFVVKVDYQVRGNEAESDLPNLMNFGLGWEF